MHVSDSTMKILVYVFDDNDNYCYVVMLVLCVIIVLAGVVGICVAHTGGGQLIVADGTISIS